MLVLGIETSCDETAVAVVENGKKILSNNVASSLHLHKIYGGVVPEIATRHHVELINFVLAQALKKAGVKLKDINLVSCVYGPGLVGALLIGLSLAKALSLSLNIPLVGINHLQAHLYAALMQKDVPQFPFLGLIVSGGHTNIFYVRDFLQWKILGTTRDDAAGEAFDKVAKILNLGYPGGPIIEQKAKKGNPERIPFPRSYLEENSLDFSFSGLKTAVLYYVRDRKKPARPGTAKRAGETSPSTALKDTGPEFNRRARNQKPDITAGFQEAVVDILSEKSIRACLVKRVENLVVGGGVSANKRLREVLQQRSVAKGIRVYFPPLALCQDNAAMVGGLGYQLFRRGKVSSLNLEVEPNLKI